MFIVMASQTPSHKKQRENAITHPQSHSISTYECDGTEAHPISTYEWDGTEDG